MWGFLYQLSKSTNKLIIVQMWLPEKSDTCLAYIRISDDLFHSRAPSVGTWTLPLGNRETNYPLAQYQQKTKHGNTLIFSLWKLRLWLRVSQLFFSFPNLAPAGFTDFQCSASPFTNTLCPTLISKTQALTHLVGTGPHGNFTRE